MPHRCWAVDIVAVAVAVTPPGYFTSNGVTAKCPAGSYRANWAAAGTDNSCTSCGAGVFAKTDLTVADYSITGVITTVAVTTVSSSCYIKTGQGLYYVTKTNSWR